MSKPHSLLVVALLLLLAAAGGLFFWPRGSEPLAIGESHAAGTTETVDSTKSSAAAPEIDTARAEIAPAAPDPEPTALDPEVAKAMAGFTGRLLRADGRAAEAERVILYEFDAPAILGEDMDLLAKSTFEPDLEVGESKTGADGRFVIRGAWPRGFYLLHAGVGGKDATALLVERTPEPGELVDLGDLRLRAGAVLTGIVVDHADQPVAGALVRVLDLPPQMLAMVPLERFDPQGNIIVKDGEFSMVMSMPGWVKGIFDRLPLPAARTDAEGKFEVTGIDAEGGGALVVNAKDTPSLLQPLPKLEPGQQRDLGRLRLRESDEVFGQVVDAVGRPVVGAEVLVGQAGSMAPMAFAFPAGPSDAKGQFTAKGMQGGRVFGAARRGPGQPWVVVGPQPVVRDLKITMPTQHRLTVNIVSAVGQAIEAPEVRLLQGRHGDGAIEIARMGFSEALDLTGKIERISDGRLLVKDVDAGRYALLVRAKGHGPAAERLEIAQDTEQLVTLAPATTLAVRVVDAAGKRVRSAQLYAEIRGGGQVSDMPVQIGRTGADGLVTAEVAAGEVHLAARHPALGQVHGQATVPGPEVTLTFESPGSIEGTLTSRGQPPELGKWTLVVSRDHSGPQVLPDMPRFTTPDLQGKFKVNGLQPGDYAVRAVDSIRDWASPGKFFKQTMTAGLMMGGSDTRIAVLPGQTTYASLDTNQGPRIVHGPSARISGSAMVDGRAATGMMLTGWADERIAGEVDASGRFDLGQVREGYLHLQLVDPDAASPFEHSGLWSRSLQITANQDQVLDIVIQTSSLVGKVTTADGTPAAGAQVNASSVPRPGDDDSHSSNSSTTTDEQGVFKFTRLCTGPYSIQVSDQESGRGTGSVTLQPGSQAEVQIQLHPTIKVSGRVDLAGLGGLTPQWMWMNWSLSGHHSNEGTQVQPDGDFEVSGLTPGDYTITLWATVKTDDPENEYDSKTFHGTAPVTVNDRDLKDIVIQIKPEEKAKGEGK